jgi:hypothetical protein
MIVTTNIAIIKWGETLVVSLSGVDPMVALETTKANQNIVAVHINYCNRDTSYLGRIC